MTEIVMDPSLGYRVDIGDTVVAYTGDTGMFDELKSIIQDADLALIEATYRKTPESTPRAHLSIDEAQKLAKFAKNHLIIHQVPDWVVRK
jgi:ribonuclease BN (tRNA processing enzyme)